MVPYILVNTVVHVEFTLRPHLKQYYAAVYCVCNTKFDKGTSKLDFHVYNSALVNSLLSLGLVLALL